MVNLVDANMKIVGVKGSVTQGDATKREGDTEM